MTLQAGGRRERFRLHVLVACSALVGVAAGLGVALFDKAVRDELFARVLDAPLGVAAVLPAIGLAVTVLVTRRHAHGDGATSDAYIRAYHEKAGGLRLRDLPAKVLATAATLGSGGAMGYEGPAILIGATFGSVAERRFTARLRQDDAKVLMVAGAAAGVAAVFKAPLTGIVFALEVPYSQDLARRALLPTLAAASTAYLTFVAILGTDPVLPVSGAAPFDLRDLAGGLAVGALCGVLARLGAWAVANAKAVRAPAGLRVAVAGAGLFALALVTDRLYDAPLSLGSGYDAIAWARSHTDAVALLAGLFAFRALATVTTVAGGGVGGLFIPLVTQGALLGALVQSVVHAPNPGLFPTVGIAAFLGGGYRTPLAGVAFVAEATGEPGFVVPALLAAAASQLVMGRWSFSPYQRRERHPELVALDRLRLAEVMTANPDTVDADERLDACAARMMRANRRWAPVTDAGRYAGLLSLADVAAVAPLDWAQLQARDVARADAAALGVDDSVAEAAARVRAGDLGAVAVLDADGTVVGVVTLRDIGNIERLLDHLAPDDADGRTAH